MRSLSRDEMQIVSGGDNASNGQPFTNSSTDAYGNTAQWTSNLSEVLVTAAPRQQWLYATSHGFGPSTFNTWYNNYQQQLFEWDGYDSTPKPPDLAGRNNITSFSQNSNMDTLIDTIGGVQDQNMAANTLAALSAWGYQFQNEGGFLGLNKYTNRVPAGFSVLTSLRNQDNGFFGVALLQQSTGDVVFVVRGTDEMVDWTQNYALGNVHLTGSDIANFTQDDSMVALINMVAPSLQPGTDVYFTGHSLGGAVATFGQAYTNAMWGITGINTQAVTFGSAPNAVLLNSWGITNKADSLNYFFSNDPLNGVSFPGTIVGVRNTIFSPDLPSVAAHDILRYAANVSDQPGMVWLSASDIQGSDPIFVDLDGNGITIDALSSQRVSIDFDLDQHYDEVAWVNPSDGVLVHDWNHDNVASGPSEIAFGAKLGYESDLDALKSLDLNHDGAFNASDSAFADFKIWRDVNGDGVFGNAELVSLSSVGIAGFKVDGSTLNVAGDGFIAPRATQTIDLDGGSRAAWDVRLTPVDRLA